MDASDACLVSAKSGMGVEDALEHLVQDSAARGGPQPRCRR